MLDDVYNKRILELAGNIPRLGRLAIPRCQRHRSFQALRLNRHRRLRMDGDTVTDFAHDVKACALGQASSSIMARNIVGAKAPDCASCARPCARCSRRMASRPDGNWADIAVLEPVRDYKARHASTMLTFDAVVSAIDQIEAKRGAQARCQVADE